MVARFRRNPALAILAVLLVGFGVPIVSSAPIKGLDKLWTAVGVAFVLGSVWSFAALLVWLRRRLFPRRDRGTRIAPSPGVVPLLSVSPPMSRAPSPRTAETAPPAPDPPRRGRRSDTRSVAAAFSVLWVLLATGLGAMTLAFALLATMEFSCDGFATFSDRLVIYLFFAIPPGLALGGIGFGVAGWARPARWRRTLAWSLLAAGVAVALGGVAWFAAQPWTQVCPVPSRHG